jgi:hypothetical protein
MVRTYERKKWGSVAEKYVTLARIRKKSALWKKEV